MSWKWTLLVLIGMMVGKTGAGEPLIEPSATPPEAIRIAKRSSEPMTSFHSRARNLRSTIRKWSNYCSAYGIGPGEVLRWLATELLDLRVSLALITKKTIL